MAENRLALQAKRVWFAYSHDQWVLKGVSLEVPRGAFVAVMGPSGSGKTTFMKVLAGFLRPQRGEVEVLGSLIGKKLPPWFRQQVGYIPQQLGLVRSLTALENVLLGSLARQKGLGSLLGFFPSNERGRAMEYLALLGIEHKAEERVFRLSGGERQRVAIARTLLQGPSVFLADEFVADLDLPRASHVLEGLRELGSRENLTFVINLHEIQLVQMFADYVITLKEGAIVHQGPAREMSWKVLEEKLR